MRWSYTIGRFAGTEVKIHVTFFLLLAWIAYTAYQDAGTAAAVSDTLFFVCFFLCILLHEFGHIRMARRFGVRTPDVILLPIGGVARLERIPEEPRQELLIALAGPAVTLAIILALAAVVLGSGEAMVLRDPLAGEVPFVARLLVSNLLVLGFNLIPAFPLDGGRVLRALLAPQARPRPGDADRRHGGTALRGGIGHSRRDRARAAHHAGGVLHLPRRRHGGECRGHPDGGPGPAGLADDGDRLPDDPDPRHPGRRPWICCSRASSASFPWSTISAAPRAS